MSPGRLCGLSLALLLVLRLGWSWQLHAGSERLAWSWLLALLPLLPFLAAWLLRLRGLWIYGGIAALWWFCHGVMEAWAEPSARSLAYAEIALSLLYFAGLLWRQWLDRVARRALPGKAGDST